MARRNILHYILEIIVIVGFLVLGVTIFTLFFYNSPFERSVIGILILTIGVLEVADFFTWKYATKMRSIQYLVSAIANVALGAVLMIVPRMDTKVMCIIWGICNIVFAVSKIATGAVNIQYQPLINSFRIVLSIIEIVFSVLLIVRTLDAVHPHMWFLGVALCINAFILFVEFIIHRYQRI